MITEKLAALGYDYKPASLDILAFHNASKVGNLIFTSGQVPIYDGKMIKGKVGTEVDVETAYKAAEICAYNCLCAAGSVADVNAIKRAVKLTGMVNVADGFDSTTEVINGATDFLNKIFGDKNGHARTAVGMVLPANFSVEIDMIFETTAP